MKNFSRTVGGKSLYFCLCVILILAFLTCAVGAALMAQYDFYGDTEPSVIKNLPDRGEYALLGKLLTIAYSLRYAIVPIGVAALAGAIALFIALMCVSARQPGSDGLFPGIFNRVPFDILVLLTAALVAAVIYICIRLEEKPVLFMEALAAGGLAAAAAVLGLSMSAAARIKQKNLFRNTLVFICLRFIWKVLSAVFSALGRFFGAIGSAFMNTPLVWRTALSVLVIFLVEFIAYLFLRRPAYAIFMFIERLILIPLIIYIAVMLRRLQAGGEALAAGDLEHKTKTDGMFMDFK